MRRRRIIVEGSSYHVYARINRKEYILLTMFVKEMFMSVLRRAKKKFKFRIINFCIMGNHVHFIIKPLKNESLSSIMQWILGVFAQKYNRTYNLQGHIWYDRFKSKVISDFRQFLHTFIYIANNPVKAGIVKFPANYQYSGISYLQKGILDVMERPPNRVLRVIWAELYFRHHSNKNRK